jgi:hypothetical protein
MNTKIREKNLWKWLRDGCKAKFYPTGILLMDRIENLVGIGFPDVDGCLSGQPFKIELKTAARPVRLTTPIHAKFQRGQTEWMKRRLRAMDVRVFVLLQVGSGSGAKRYLVPSCFAAAVETGRTEDELEQLSVTPPKATASEIVLAAATFSNSALRSI